jgi:hypothetical protein
MNTRIALRLWLALALFGLDALAWAYAVHSGPNRVSTATASASAPKTTLPAVLLPSVTVHPDADSLASAEIGSNSGTVLDFEPVDNVVEKMPAFPHLRLSVPYYSFGKLLPHVRKD